MTSAISPDLSVLGEIRRDDLGDLAGPHRHPRDPS
jgi:hypothetical protein